MSAGGVDAVGGLYRPERRQGRDVTHHRRLANGLRGHPTLPRPLPLPRLCRSMTWVLRKATSLSAVTRSPSSKPRVFFSRILLVFKITECSGVSIPCSCTSRRRIDNRIANGGYLGPNLLPMSVYCWLGDRRMEG
jgi:hypothetical protein